MKNKNTKKGPEPRVDDIQPRQETATVTSNVAQRYSPRSGTKLHVDSEMINRRSNDTVRSECRFVNVIAKQSKAKHKSGEGRYGTSATKEVAMHEGKYIASRHKQRKPRHNT